MEWRFTSFSPFRYAAIRKCRLGTSSDQRTTKVADYGTTFAGNSREDNRIKVRPSAAWSTAREAMLQIPSQSNLCRSKIVKHHFYARITSGGACTK